MIELPEFVLGERSRSAAFVTSLLLKQAIPVLKQAIPALVVAHCRGAASTSWPHRNRGRSGLLADLGIHSPQEQEIIRTNAGDCRLHSPQGVDLRATDVQQAVAYPCYLLRPCLTRTTSLLKKSSLATADS
jgi:hypothetical protein